MFKSILITGGCGFIGSHFVRLALQRWPQARIVNFDLLTYAANPANLADCADNERYHFVHGDIRDAGAVMQAFQDHGCDAVAHLAAESHVDRSILKSDETITTNVIGTHILLEAAVRVGVQRFMYVSTDEVYGSIAEPDRADESATLLPSSPYAVAKTSADLMTRTYFVTYDLPAVITRSCNNFGPNQYPEKLIPLFVSHLLEDKKVPVYGDGRNIRDWLYVTDHCEALARVMERGRFGETYNIGADQPRSNLEVVNLILDTLGKDESFIEYVKDRPGHDRRYAVDSAKIATELGWRPTHPFDESLRDTVRWYRDHRHWWHPIKAGEFQDYYTQQYEQRE